jgi:hypothetical protein
MTLACEKRGALFAARNHQGLSSQEENIFSSSLHHNSHDMKTNQVTVDLNNELCFSNLSACKHRYYELNMITQNDVIYTMRV